MDTRFCRAFIKVEDARRISELRGNLPEIEKAGNFLLKIKLSVTESGDHEKGERDAGHDDCEGYVDHLRSESFMRFNEVVWLREKKRFLNASDTYRQETLAKLKLTISSDFR